MIKELLFLLQKPFLFLVVISLLLIVIKLSAHYVKLTNFPLWTNVVNEEQEKYIEDYRTSNPQEYKKHNLPEEKSYLVYHYFFLKRVLEY